MSKNDFKILNNRCIIILLHLLYFILIHFLTLFLFFLWFHLQSFSRRLARGSFFLVISSCWLLNSGRQKSDNQIKIQIILFFFYFNSTTIIIFAYMCTQFRTTFQLCSPEHTQNTWGIYTRSVGTSWQLFIPKTI